MEFGRHASLKTKCPDGRAGSNPATPTKTGRTMFRNPSGTWQCQYNDIQYWSWSLNDIFIFKYINETHYHVSIMKGAGQGAEFPLSWVAVLK